MGGTPGRTCLPGGSGGGGLEHEYFTESNMNYQEKRKKRRLLPPEHRPVRPMPVSWWPLSSLCCATFLLPLTAINQKVLLPLHGP